MNPTDPTSTIALVIVLAGFALALLVMFVMAWRCVQGFSYRRVLSAEREEVEP